MNYKKYACASFVNILTWGGGLKGHDSTGMISNIFEVIQWGNSEKWNLVNGHVANKDITKINKIDNYN